MSSRSIVEINHDHAGRIERNRDLFMGLLERALSNSIHDNWAKLLPFGVRLITTCHHTEERKVIVGKELVQREYPVS